MEHNLSPRQAANLLVAVAGAAEGRSSVGTRPPRARQDCSIRRETQRRYERSLCIRTGRDAVSHYGVSVEVREWTAPVPAPALSPR